MYSRAGGQFTVIAVDTPGQGKSEQLEQISYEILGETMSTFIDFIKRLFDSLNVCNSYFWSLNLMTLL